MQYSRQDFCENVFQYGPGEHVVFGGASTNGKTSLAFDMLEYIVTPKFPAYVAVSKPRDPVTLKRGNELGFRTVPDWPPQKQLKEYEIFGGKKPNGYLIWSAFGDLNTDMPRAAAVTRKLIMERYANGVHGKDSGGILVMDDTMVKAKIMGLDNEMVTILAMAGAMDIGLWVFVQKPTDSGRTTTWSYEQAKHLLLTRGGDARMLDRYSEIIGTNGKYAKAVIPTLKPFQFVYINKTDDTMCIVGAK
jgi:hypothetical protein